MPNKTPAPARSLLRFFCAAQLARAYFVGFRVICLHFRLHGTIGCTVARLRRGRTESVGVAGKTMRALHAQEIKQLAISNEEPHDSKPAVEMSSSKNKKAPGLLPVPPCSGPAFHGLLRLRAPSVEVGALTISAGLASSRCRGSRPFPDPAPWYPEGWSLERCHRRLPAFMAASVRRSRSRIALDRPRWTFPTRFRIAACAAIRPLSRGPQVVLSDFAPLSGREPLSA